MEKLKIEAAEYALRYVESGMRLGLGTGSTSQHFVRALGNRIKAGEIARIVAVPTSESTAQLAKELGIPLASLDDVIELDLTVDGADEVDPNLDLIKGLGGAHLREKIVEANSRQFIVIVDQTKLVKRLGEKVPLPVEVTPFCWKTNLRWLRTLGCEPELRENADGSPFISDGGNLIIHCRFHEGLNDPYRLNRILNDHPGMLGHGLFLNMASAVIVASSQGIQLMEKEH